jgi:hypothetical protein
MGLSGSGSERRLLTIALAGRLAFMTVTRLLSILAVFALSVGAADLSGKWSGTLEGTGESGSAFLILKQEGTTITGSGGPNESEQHPLRNGKVEGNQLTFEVPVGEGGEKVMRFKLAANGDQIEGEVTARAKDEGGETRKGRLPVKRVKSN